MKKILMIILTAIFFMVSANGAVYASGQQVSFSLPLTFKWGYGGLVRGQTYKIKLTASKENTPMPKGSQGSEYTKNIPEGTTKDTLPPITYTSTGDYEYKLQLIRGKNIGLKKYYLHVQVLNRGHGELYIVTAIRQNTETGKKVTEVKFVDIGDDENLIDKDHNSSSEDSSDSSDRSDEYLKDRSNSKDDQNESKSKNSVRSGRTGDDKKVGLYLVLSIVSLSLILIMGSHIRKH